LICTKKAKQFQKIAKARNLSAQTIENHLSFYITSEELSIDEMVDKEKQKAISNAIELYGNKSLKLLKDNLPEEISYGDIRMIIAFIPLN
jgi:ATP-dependent DNA helicase RecQ